ncbi:amidase [Echinimonas agarilytica]|uniref:Amidase n=1 Tax=Echinimonas agarilytica TaxID=1215918 RepID=A0AA41W8U5_9GAMM|nr:amidase [Echinimonas agarilytica]MCM2680234.1 amidase [Echinimonas agarilytica]
MITPYAETDLSVFSWRHSAPTPISEGPISGLRLGVKDLFHIHGIPTGAGNPDWLKSHAIPNNTSPAVQELLDAGALLVGKTQTDELAYSLNGCNCHYGTPANTAASGRLPGGSSSGSAVATALNLVDIGLGTDTGGSIRVPASYNGLFGIRTSHGIVSTQHMVPLAPRFDTVGWMCRSAEHLFQAGKVLLPNTIRYAERPIRVAVIEAMMHGKSLWTESCQTWLNQQPQLTAFHHVLLEQDWLEGASDCFRTLQGRDIWQTHGEWINQHNPTFGPDIQQRLDWAANINDGQHNKAESTLKDYQSVIASWFHHTDVLLLPTTPGAAPKLDASSTTLENYRKKLMGLTAIAGLAGLPQVHLPVLMQDGAPAGLSIVGRAGSDLALLELVHRLFPSSPLKNNNQGDAHA